MDTGIAAVGGTPTGPDGGTAPGANGVTATDASPPQERREGSLAYWLSQFSFGTRVTALAAAAVGLAIALAAITSYVIVSHQLTNQVNAALQKDAGNLQLSQNLERIAPNLALANADVIQVIQANGTIQFSTQQQIVFVPTLRERAVSTGAQNKELFANMTVGGTSYRVLTLPVQLQTLQGGLSPGAVMIAHSLSQTHQTLSELRLVLLSVGLAGVALAIALGLLVARVTIRPVKRLTAAVEHVAVTQDLDARIDEEGEDELARLGHAFNEMLRALAASRTQQAQLISDAGHELRTPLTSLRTNVEVLMRVHDLPNQDRVELLADVQGQLEELTNLIGDIVDLARHDEQSPEPAEISFDALVVRAVERARRRAPSLQFRVQMEPGAILAQPALLERAVLNVLDNAAKWSPPGGAVDLWLRRSDRWLLDVRDYGPGIAAEDLPRVFDRFYRAPSARAMPGSGLGLAIVRQVIIDHGGRVGASCPESGGTLIHIELPLVVEPDPDDPGRPDEADIPAVRAKGPTAAGSRISSFSPFSQTALSASSARRDYVDPVLDPPAAGFFPS